MNSIVDKLTFLVWYNESEIKEVAAKCWSDGSDLKTVCIECKGLLSKTIFELLKT